jgi:hypothetical protein
MSFRRCTILLCSLLLSSTGALAQKADVAFVAGGAFATDGKVFNGIICITAPCPNTVTVQTADHGFFAGAVGYRLANFKLASLHVELPLAGVPSSSVTIGFSPALVEKFSSVFITPSLRVKLAPGAAISPFASVGGGWARYNNGADAHTKPAFQVGGGLDIKTPLHYLGFRAEARDFITGQPDFGLVFATSGGAGSSVQERRHNLLAGGGVVLKF